MIEKPVSAPLDCNFCKRPLQHRFIDMIRPVEGLSETVEKSQHIIPTFICNHCFLIQVDNRQPADVSDHEYLTSYSPIWLPTMQEYTSAIFKKMEQTSAGFVLELIDHCIEDKQSVKPSVATITKKDIYAFIEMYGKADRIICHNEMAYAVDISDFIEAIKLLLAPDGTFTMEFPHLLVLLENNKCTDLVASTFNYFSLTTIDIIFKKHNLVIYNTEDCMPEGCIRISGKHQENVVRHISRNTPTLRGRERDKGLSSITYYLNFKLDMERQIKSYEMI